MLKGLFRHLAGDLVHSRLISLRVRPLFVSFPQKRFFFSVQGLTIYIVEVVSNQSKVRNC